MLCEGLSSRCSGADRIRMRTGGLAIAKGDCAGTRYTLPCTSGHISTSTAEMPMRQQPSAHTHL